MHEGGTRATAICRFCVTKCWDIHQPFSAEISSLIFSSNFSCFPGLAKNRNSLQSSRRCCTFVDGESKQQHLISLLHDLIKTVSNRDSFTPQQGNIERRLYQITNNGHRTDIFGEKKPQRRKQRTKATILYTKCKSSLKTYHKTFLLPRTFCNSFFS